MSLKQLKVTSEVYAVKSIINYASKQDRKYCWRSHLKALREIQFQEEYERNG